MSRRGNLSQMFIDILNNPGVGFAKHAQKVVERYVPEAGPVLDVARHLSDKNAHNSASSASTQQNLGTPQDIMNNLRKEHWGIIPCVGMQGSGKSILSLWMMRMLGTRHNYAIGLQDYQRPSYVKPINSISDIMHLPKRSCVIVDDASISAGLGTYHQKQGKDLIDIVALCRHMELYLIINIQNTAMMNRHALDTTQLVLFKQPAQTAEMERPAFRKVYVEVQKAFFPHYNDKKWIHSHVYLWSPIWSGLIQYNADQLVQEIEGPFSNP